MFTQLAGFYFFYFALLGAMVPYLGLYFESQGLTLWEISQLMSILMFTKVLAPNIWGWIADSTGKRLLLVRLGSVLAALSFSGFFYAEGFWSYAGIIVVYSFFWNAILAQFEVLTLHQLGGEHARYSLVRLWGSIGFIVAVVLLGWVFEVAGLRYLPLAMLFILLGIAAMSFQALVEPKRSVNHVATEPVHGFVDSLKKPSVLAFFAASLLLQLSHGAYYTYYSIYLEFEGYSKTAIGLFWALGVAAEVVLFMVMHRWLAKHSDSLIMFIALMASALRWILIAYGVTEMWVLLLAQILHAMSFGAMHAAAIHFVHQNFVLALQGRAQALYSSAGFGLGGALGAFLSGWMVTQLSYSAAFSISAVLALLAGMILFRYHLRAGRRHTLPV